MRSALLVIGMLVACEGGQSPPDGAPGDRPPLPAECEGRPIVDGPPTRCFDSVMCYFDEDGEEWVIVFCDPPFDPCLECNANQLCVQRFDGTCNVTTTCTDSPGPSTCPPATCSPECEEVLCGLPFQCQNAAPCGTESPGAFYCYGP